MRPDLILPNNAPNHAALAAARDAVMSEIRVGAAIQIMAALTAARQRDDSHATDDHLADLAVKGAEALVIRLGDAPTWRSQP